MADTPAAISFKWDTPNRVLIVSDQTGKVSLKFPIIGLPALGFQAQKFMAGERAKLARDKAAQERTGWLGISAPTAQTARVQTMQTLQGERIVLILDPDTDGEFPVSLASREFAREVGQALVAAADAEPLSDGKPN